MWAKVQQPKNMYDWSLVWLNCSAFLSILSCMFGRFLCDMDKKQVMLTFTSYTPLIYSHVGCGMCTCEACSSQFWHTKFLTLSYIPPPLFFYHIWITWYLILIVNIDCKYHANTHNWWGYKLLRNFTHMSITATLTTLNMIVSVTWYLISLW